MSLLNLRTCNLLHQHIAHEHAYHQLILATSGTTELSIEGNGERITRERGCLIPTSYHHEYLGDGYNKTLVLDIPLTTLPALSFNEEIKRLFAKPRFFTVAPSLQRLAIPLMQQAEYYPTLQNDIATLILRSLYRALYDHPVLMQDTLLPATPQRERLNLARIDNYIDTHLAEPLQVETLAALCALSSSHFHTLFRKATGQTPLAYVQERRLEHARMLINQTNFPLGHIASLIGYCDQASFTRAYRRHTGARPSAHRRNIS